MDKNNHQISDQCRWSDWQIINDFWDHDFVCTYYRGVHCYKNENCELYEAEKEKGDAE